MSRARQTAHVHAVADNIYQAVEDLTWDWSRERRQAWAIDTGTPADQERHPLDIEADKQAPGKLRAVLGRARLKAERAAMAATALDQADPSIRRQVANLDRHIQLLDQRLEPRRGPFARPARDIPAMPYLDTTARYRERGAPRLSRALSRFPRRVPRRARSSIGPAWRKRPRGEPTYWTIET